MSWIQKDPQTLKTFTANRVAIVRRLMADKPFNYIAHAENPAVIAAHGRNADELVKERCWWHGPNWLTNANSSLVWGAAVPQASGEICEAVKCEQKPTSIGLIRLPYWWIADRYSSFTKMATMVAILRKCIERWRKNVERKRSGTFENVLDAEGVVITREDAKFGLPEKVSNHQIEERLIRMRCQGVTRKRITGLTRNELIDGERYWWQLVQRNTFATEYAICKKGGEQLPKSSRLSRLSPFMSDDGVCCTVDLK